MDSAAIDDILGLAAVLATEGRCEQAVSTLERLHGESLSSSERGRALAVEVVALEGLGDGAQADERILETMKDEEEDLAFVLACGTTFSDMGSFENSEVFLRNLIELDPKSHIPWYNLAVAFGRKGDYEAALESYDACLELNAGFAQAHVHRAYCLQVTEQLPEALAANYRYLELEPEDGAVWSTVATLETEQNDHDKAYAAYEKAVSFSNDLEEVHFNWGITAMERGDVERLRLSAEALEAIDPSGWRALLTRADFEDAGGNERIAWPLYGEALNAALREPDPVIPSYVAASLLKYVYRRDDGARAIAHIDQIFKHALFTEETLELLRLLQGLSSDSVRSYEVVVKYAEGTWPDQPGDHGTRYRMLGVSAEEPQQAIDAGIEFEERCGFSSVACLNARPLNEPAQGLVGVYWRSDLLAQPPGNTGESDIQRTPEGAQP